MLNELPTLSVLLLLDGLERTKMRVEEQGAQDTINAYSDADGVANVRITIPRVLPTHALPQHRPLSVI